MERFNYPKWSEINYAGEQELPIAIETSAGLWPTYFIFRDSFNNYFIYSCGRPIRFMIRNPKTINFQSQLWQTQNVLKNITDKEITIAEYWNEGPPTKQWTPIDDRLIDTYDVTAPQAGRILAALQAGINDAFVVAWHH